MLLRAPLHRKLALAAVVAALSLIPAAPARAQFFPVHITITNVTPSTLTLVDNQIFDPSNVTCWADSSGACQRSGPQQEIDPGSVADLFLASSEGIAPPSIAAGVTYVVQDPNVGFHGSGVAISLKRPIAEANSAECDAIGYFA